MPTILFVEDDPLIMLSAASMLEDHGWTVKKAANGAVAIERFPELASDVDAMVVDIRLGQGPNGWDVARYARSLSRKLPVAYITGDDHAALSNVERVDGGVVLRKPITGTDLVAALRRLIGIDARRRVPKQR
ncbi:MAG: response regulator [Sphingomonadales bacterium]|nr:MAG: response regulator [Sphingomonadales bacterium]